MFIWHSPVRIQSGLACPNRERSIKESPPWRRGRMLSRVGSERLSGHIAQFLFGRKDSQQTLAINPWCRMVGRVRARERKTSELEALVLQDIGIGIESGGILLVSR